MTANELAVYLEDITDSEKSPYRQAATMLRQQQAEIEELKTIRGNSVLVPSDKLQAMQSEIEALKVKAHKWYLIAMEKEQKKND